MKITIYELLGLIKDGKAPKRIKVTGTIYEYDEESKFYFAHFKNYSVALGGKEDEINLLYNAFNENEVEILEDKPSEEIRKLQSEIDILTNKVEHYYSEVVSFRDKTRYLKDELKKLKEEKWQ